MATHIRQLTWLMLCCALIVILPASKAQAQAPTAKRIGIQAGHGTGGDSGSLSCDKSVKEADITWVVANKAAELLRACGYQVDVFRGEDPTLRGYVADAFLALHTDFCAGNNSGYKVSRRGGVKGTGLNGSGDASDQLAQTVWTEYGAATGLARDTSPGHFTDDMIYYYALGQVSAQTPAAIIEMGWLSGDYDLLVNQQVVVAQGIANSLAKFVGGTSSSGNSEATATTLIVDISGSMGDAWQGGVKIESAKTAATDILNMIEQESELGSAQHQIGLVTFSTVADLNLPLTTDYASARAAVSGLSPTDRTNIGAGLQVANQALALSTAKKIIILLSDGKTNAGLSPAEILNGPVQDAKTSDTCIYTIGIGDTGDLDVSLLSNIATQSGCGEYYYANAASQLEEIYIKLRHQSLGNIIGEFSGQIAQGQTAPIGQVDVPANQGTLYVTLHWPGSALDLIVTDPGGRRITPNYPGANLQIYDRLVYLIVQNPRPGAWQAQTFGREVPEGTLTYDALFSVRQGTARSTSTDFLPVLGAVLLIVAVAGGVAVSANRLGQSGPVVQVMRGQATRPFARVGRSGLSIGRDPRNGLTLHDPKVSRQHARIMHASQGYYIADLQSSGGTFVNGQPYKQKGLNSGDVIRLGETELVFQPQAGLQAISATPLTAGPPSNAYFTGNGQTYLIPLTGGVIGRAPNCLIVINNEAISMQHAQVNWQGAHCFITDLNSRNGTFVNGQCVTRPTALQAGSIVRIGNVDLIFNLTSLP